MRAGERVTCASCGGTIPRGSRLTVNAGRWTHETPADCERREPVVAGPVRPFVLLRGGCVVSAETLREAVRLMRERAQVATYVYAEHHPKAGQEVPWFDAADAYAFDEGDGPHIKSWSPAVALAVADWLEHAARCHEIALQHGKRGLRPDGYAMTVARAYLGEPS